jgi:GH35 family endo-1,4-beta-xylanase
MSYDLMVFEKTKAPKTKEEFMRWYGIQTEWSEEHDYQTPSVASEKLQNWYNAMKSYFPPMNGVDSPTDEQIEEDEELENRLADYCIGRDVIYVAFAWSKADEAYKLTKQFAKQYDVGFFNVSAIDGEIVLPEGTIIT